jgi:hypothetical protein
MAGIRAEDFREALAQFWKEKGVALCAEAQGDGVPCSELGRSCETCAAAVKALHEARQAELRARRP